MAYFLIQVAYTAEGWAAQIKNPQNVVERTRASFEKLGGSVVGAWYAFGDYDLVAIAQFPDSVNVAAYALTAVSGGAGMLKSFKTTPLLSVEEGLAAMKKAGETQALYRPPGS